MSVSHIHFLKGNSTRRRIEKVDAIAGTTTRYYYDDQRVAVQTQVAGGVETDDRYFVFGNTIDAVLVMGVTSAWAWPTLRDYAAILGEVASAWAWATLRGFRYYVFGPVFDRYSFHVSMINSGILTLTAAVRKEIRQDEITKNFCTPSHDDGDCADRTDDFLVGRGKTVACAA